ncbi:probable cytochrome P450 313a4 [Musca autumnalis]|uniref:probable cytochrome P450 313a4 n=1 Tax=Musca autumnalis TaxID=221902 RepID=UPI003CEB4CDA
MELFFIFALSSVAILWLFYRWSDRRIIQFASKVGSYKSQVILGFGAIETPATLLRNSIKNCRKLGHNYLTYVGPFPHFFTSDPETIKCILTSKLTRSKPKLSYSGFRHALGNGLLTMTDKEWQPHRKLLDVAFKFSKVVEFVPIFNNKISRLFEELDTCHVMENSHEILVFCREYMMTITGETMLGRDLDKSPTFDVKYCAQRVTRALEYISEIMFNILYLIMYFTNIKFIIKLADIMVLKEKRKILDFFRNQIDETYNHYSKGTQNDIEYLENSDKAIARYFHEIIKNNIIKKDLAITSMMHIFAASFESTSSTLYKTMLMLAIHPEYQEKVYAEICKMFPANDGGEFQVTYEHVTQLTYLDMFIKETMRIFATIPMFGRLAVGGDLTLSNGIVIPEGLEMGIDVYNLHRNKDVWGSEADTFNPDNFLPSNVEKRHPYAYVPFAKGLRNCIGMRFAEVTLRVAMAKLIKRYKFSTTAKIEDFVLFNRISLDFDDHPPLTIEQRSKLSN